MAELNDKLITYGNLSTFYDKLQEQGLGGKAIEEVDALPEASENKDKLFRLSSDDNVYVSELKSRTSTTTNRLPDAQQIDKAYLYTADDGWVFNYKGSYTLLCADGSINGYGWHYYDAGDDINYFIITFDNNAENIHTNSSYYWCETYANIDFENRIIDVVGEGVPGISVSDVENSLSALDDSEFVIIPIPATYNAPEANQIGNATLVDGLNLENGLYTGEQITFEDTDGGGEQIIGYRWTDLDDSENYCFATDKPASQIYFYYDEDNNVFYTDAKLWVVDLSEYTSEHAGFNTIYIPQLNAPDSEQVDNAYIDETYFGARWLYEGEEITVEYQGDDITIYTWKSSESIYAIGSSKRAYEIYNTDRDSDDVHFYALDEDNYIQEIFFDDYLTSISIVKYQRTAVVEEWNWEDITPTYASDSDIDDLFGTPSGDKFYLLKASNRYGAVQNEAFVHTAGDTVNYNGQTCYRWYKQEDDGGTLGSDVYWDDNDMYMLTNTLNIHLPFNKYSDEFVAIISNDSPTSYLASFDKDDFVEMIIE